VAAGPDLINFFGGPFPLDRGTLCSAHASQELPVYHVAIEADSVQRLFAGAYTVGSDPYTYCGLLQLGDKWLLVQLPADHAGNWYRGVIEPFTPFEKQYLLERLRAKYPDRELLPFRLNMTRPLWVGVAYGRLLPLALLLALAVWRTVVAWRHCCSTRAFQCAG
jgi:hypothetical protein